MRRIFLITLIILFLTLPIFAQTHTVWINTYDGPGEDNAYDIAIDDSGYVYITGPAGYSRIYDYQTIKYYPNGDTCWVRRYKSPGNGEDVTYDIAVDNSGNVFVSGVTGYLQTGTGPYDDITTIKYYPNGDTAWVRNYSRSTLSTEFSRDMVVDSYGNCYVTGYSSSKSSISDYITIKYYTNGDVAWVRRYDGPCNRRDESFALAIDGSGNVYVTGASDACTTGSDFIASDLTTIKYNSAGKKQWLSRYKGVANYRNEARDIAIDEYHNIYVTGYTWNSTTGVAVITVKYNPDGNELWAKTYKRSEPYFREEGRNLALDGNGNVYVSAKTGYFSTFEKNDYLTIKYDHASSEIWARIYDGPGNSRDDILDMAVDNSGNLYVTGWSWGISNYDYATIKYDAYGNEACVKRYGSTHQLAHAIALDDSGYVYVTGGDRLTITTIKYHPFSLAGDSNGNGEVTLSDVVYLVNYLFKEGPVPNPIGSADVNDNESVDLNDIVYLINYLFKSGPSPIC